MVMDGVDLDVEGAVGRRGPRWRAAKRLLALFLLSRAGLFTSFQSSPSQGQVL